MKILNFIAFFSIILSLSVESATWQGQWDSTFGKINFQEKPTEFQGASLVFGNYSKDSIILGVSIKHKLHGMFFDTKLDKKGSFVFTLNELQDKYKGSWKFDDINKELRWNGSRANKQKEIEVKGVDRYRNIEGAWKTNFGTLTLTQEGVFIKGIYDKKGKIFAVFNKKNKVVYGLFTNKDKWGMLKFNLNDEKNEFKGLWSWETDNWAEQKWDGEKLNK